MPPVTLSAPVPLLPTVRSPLLAKLPPVTFSVATSPAFGATVVVPYEFAPELIVVVPLVTVRSAAFTLSRSVPPLATNSNKATVPRNHMAERLAGETLAVLGRRKEVMDGSPRRADDGLLPPWRTAQKNRPIFFCSHPIRRRAALTRRVLEGRRVVMVKAHSKGPRPGQTRGLGLQKPVPTRSAAINAPR